MTAVPTFAGTVLPDTFVGVPYLAGLPVKTAVSANVTAVTVSAGALPPGLSVVASAPLVSGTVQVSTSAGTQVDGAYSFTIQVTDSANNTLASAMTMNVHYLTTDQDLSVAAQAAIRSGEIVDDTQPEDVGTVDTPGTQLPADTLPTDVG
jgi:hypothetical protein